LGIIAIRSEGNHVSSIPDQYSDLLESTALAHIATLGPDGSPQVNPVWFGWDGEFIRFSNTKNRQKYRNLSRDPRIALSIVDPTNPYRYLEVRGTVVDLEDDPSGAYIDFMAQKYLGEEKYPWARPGDERVTIVVKPERVTSMG